jgi:N-acetyl sugar amidotransferase
MQYCIKCLQPNTRPNSQFTNGICPVCIYQDSIKNVDWNERLDLLRQIIKPYVNKKPYNCIVGISGGKDSTRQALWVRDKLRLNPLLICMAYPPEQVSNVGADNISNLINLGFDVEIISISPIFWKNLLKIGFLKFCNWAKFTEQAIISSVPRAAIRHNINIIFWGENPADAVGDLKTSTLKKDEGYDGSNLMNMHTVSGGKIDWISDEYNLPKEKLYQFEFPSLSDLKKNKIQIIYLGWFWNDWSIKKNGLISSLYGLNLRKDHYKNTQDIRGIFSLDEDWVTFNQMIKYYKYGFGRVSDYINEDIRSNYIRREEAISIVEKYDHCCSDNYIKDFCRYINISQEDFWFNIRKNVNKNLFHIDNKLNIKKKFKVGKGL